MISLIIILLNVLTGYLLHISIIILIFLFYNKIKEQLKSFTQKVVVAIAIIKWSILFIMQRILLNTYIMLICT